MSVSVFQSEAEREGLRLKIVVMMRDNGCFSEDQIEFIVRKRSRYNHIKLDRNIVL